MSAPDGALLTSVDIVVCQIIIVTLWPRDGLSKLREVPAREQCGIALLCVPGLCESGLC